MGPSQPWDTASWHSGLGGHRESTSRGGGFGKLTQQHGGLPHIHNQQFDDAFLNDYLNTLDKQTRSRNKHDDGNPSRNIGVQKQAFFRKPSHSSYDMGTTGKMRKK